MKSNCIFLIYLICLFCSCKPKQEFEAPIPEDKMVAIMSEIYYLDGHFAELNSYLKDSIVFMKLNELLNGQGISLEQFKKAKDYYSENEEAKLRLEEAIKKSIEEASMK